MWAALAFCLLLANLWQYAIAARAQPSAVEFVACQLVAGAVYLGAVYVLFRNPQAVSFRYVLLLGVLCRLLLLPTAPLFDDDIHRYVWEGRVVANGLNPFLYPPLAGELAFLRDANWTHVGYPQIRSIYPPLAQLLFGLSYLLGARTIVGLKAVLLLFDLANMLLIGALLGLLRRPRSWALIYAWSPLATKEFANSGHVEPVMLFFLLGMLYLCLTPRRAHWPGLSFGAALSVKPAPLLLVPILWRVWGWRPLAWGLGLLVALYLPFAGAGKLLFSGAGAYAQYWTFNPGAFALLSWAQSALLPRGGVLPVSPARLLSALLIAAYALYAAYRLRPADTPGVIGAMRNVLAVCLLLAPTVDPWYVCWLLPFLCLAPSPALLLLCVTCNLSYLYYARSSFPVWIPLLEYLPVYGLLVAQRRLSQPRRGQIRLVEKSARTASKESA